MEVVHPSLMLNRREEMRKKGENENTTVMIQGMSMSQLIRKQCDT